MIAAGPKDPKEYVAYCGTLDYSNIQDLILLEESELIRMENSLQAIKNNNYEEGKDGQPNIAGRTEAAIKWQRWRLHTANNFYYRLRQQHAQGICHKFMETAKVLLPQDQYNTILNEAKALAHGDS